jgi:hypothetical protein
MTEQLAALFEEEPRAAVKVTASLMEALPSVVGGPGARPGAKRPVRAPAA